MSLSENSPILLDNDSSALENFYFGTLGGSVIWRFTVKEEISTSHSLVIVYPPGYGNLRASGLSCKITPILAVGTAAADTI